MASASRLLRLLDPHKRRKCGKIKRDLAIKGAYTSLLPLKQLNWHKSRTGEGEEGGRGGGGGGSEL